MRGRPKLIAFLLLFCATWGPRHAHAASVGLKIRFGLKSQAPARWDGRVRVDPGRVVGIEGWRFDRGDHATADGWVASTRPSRTVRRSNRPGERRAVEEPALDNGVTLALEGVTERSRVEVDTAQGNFAVTLADVPFGRVRPELDGAVEIERTAAARPLTSTDRDEDFPAAAVDSHGRTHVAWVRFTPAHPGGPRILELGAPPRSFSFLEEPTGGDQVVLATLTATGRSAEIPITEPGRDVYKCAVAAGGDGRVWVVWSERRDGEFEVWGRAVRDGVPEAAFRFSTGHGNQHSPVAATDARGRVWVAWQGVRDGTFQILARRQREDGSFGPEILVSPHAASSWAPAIAATGAATSGDARVAIVWDTYEKGDYDVWVREFDLDGTPREPAPAANTPGYEARSSAAYDLGGNLWIAWEESGPTWGKDRGALVRGKGIGLLANRQIGSIVRTPDGRWLQTAGAIGSVMPKPNVLVVPKRDPGEPLSEAARAAAPLLGVPYHNLSRLAVDADGRPWLLFRSRAIDFRPTVGSMWLGYAAYYEGDHWVGPILLPNSDNLLYSAPAVVAPRERGLQLVYASDHRQLRKSTKGHVRAGSLEVTQALSDPWTNDLYGARLEVAETPAAATLIQARNAPTAAPAPTRATLEERRDIAHARSARTVVHGTEWRLVRGEFHRHTEISSDGGSDGPLEDMWRYSLDVAALDWVGNGDHDSGQGREYPWWLIQKTTDAFRIDDRFTTLFSYERSRPFPEGHRNVVFPRRGVRPLPRLPMAKATDPGPAPDTKMLYRHLAELGGISVPHTSATRMGTDWRNRDDTAEPLVEIYQGSRNSYEKPGAPRTATGALAREERAEGFVSNALGRGHRLGFIASSDHHSTHISYAMVWVDRPGRQSIFDALRSRRAYAATDDIVADVRVTHGDGEAFMGEEMTSTTPANLHVRLEGTAPFAKVTVVKDGAEVQSFAPNQAELNLDWTDPSPSWGATSYYYVRGEQADGELVWTSPIWVTYEEPS